MALEASAEVPKMEVVIERLLHEERKMKTRLTSSKKLKDQLSIFFSFGIRCTKNDVRNGGISDILLTLPCMYSGHICTTLLSWLQ